jgi:hypothetical protein
MILSLTGLIPKEILVCEALKPSHKITTKRQIREILFSLHRDFLKFSLSKEIFIPIGTFSACGNWEHTKKLPTQTKRSLWGREISNKGRKFLLRESRISILPQQ